MMITPDYDPIVPSAFLCKFDDAWMKITNSRTILMELMKEHPEGLDDVRDFTREMQMEIGRGYGSIQLKLNEAYQKGRM